MISFKIAKMKVLDSEKEHAPHGSGRALVTMSITTASKGDCTLKMCCADKNCSHSS